MGSLKDTLLLPKTDMPIKADLPAHEPAVYEAWDKSHVYDRMKRDGANPFILHDGPPYANGDIHIGHALNKILKDFAVKFQYFNGRAVEFVPGWDCHGLPIEKKVMETAHDGNLYPGPSPLKENVRELCRKYAGEQIQKQMAQFKTLGVLADWDNHYETMAPEFEATIAAKLEELREKGYISQRLKPVYWSWKERTALAEAEVEYQDRTDLSVYVAFPTDYPTFPGGLLVWTTTPWTLPANVAVAIDPEAKYVAAKVQGFPSPLVVAAGVFEELRAKSLVTAVVGEVDPRELTKIPLKHPIYADQKVPVILAEFVAGDKGTGCVHIAPGHGEADFQIGHKRYGLPVVMPVGPDGVYTEGKYAGMHVFDANKVIVEDLTQRGLLVGTEKITHSYPYCWRSKTPLIFRATPQWFVDLDKVRTVGPALENVEFFPDHTRTRLQNMLNRSDWCISRQRKWGVPIFDSEDILDVWFDSGLTWTTLKGRTADVYLEGNDQHRGWFQSSLWLSVMLQGHAPYKKVVTHGFVVDQNGKKMAKSEGNVVSPLEVTQKHGAEVLRYWVASTDYTKDLQCSDEIIKRAAEGYKKLRNTLRYLVSNLPEKEPCAIDPQTPFRKFPDECLFPVDDWIVEKSRAVFADVHKAFSEYSYHFGMQRLMEFITTDLSGIYMAAVKDRLYCAGENSYARNSALSAMSRILRPLLGLLAPLFTYTVNEVLGYAPAWFKGEIKDVFDLVYEPLPTYKRQTWSKPFAESHWKQALTAFHVEFDKLKQQGVCRDTLEVFIESDGPEPQSRYFPFFNGAEDWFVVSRVSNLSGQPALAEFTVDNVLYRVVRSPMNKCVRCWKRTAAKEVCRCCDGILGGPG